MEAEEKIDILLKGVPKDVADELDRRADEHFRSRTGEILSILVTECRKPAVGSVVPGKGVGRNGPGGVR